MRKRTPSSVVDTPRRFESIVECVKVMLTRSARAMLHLRNTLPRFFDADQSTSTLFPADIFSPHMSLKLHHPIPLKVRDSCFHFVTPVAFERCGTTTVIDRVADIRSRHCPDTPSPSL